MSKLRSLIRQTLTSFQFGRRLVVALDRRHEAQRAAARLAQIGDRGQVFTHHFHTNEWRNGESVSGSGSTLRYTENIRQHLPLLVSKLGVSVFLDAPCGDFNWFRLVDLPAGVRYIGADIVGPLIEQNRARYAGGNREFRTLDIVEQPLPAADLWMCRDCLIHLSNFDVFGVLRNFVNSDVKYLLTTTHTACLRNVDISTGSFRQINLEMAPFDLGPPMLRIDDWVEGFPIRHLALWEREALARRLHENPAFQDAVSRSGLRATP